MRVEIIDNINQFPQFEAQNVFQTKDYMRLFEHEKGTKVVIFAVYFGSSLLLLQPLTIHRYYRYLPGKFVSYAVAWREPWRAQNITDEEAIKAFDLMNEMIVKYCRKRALYVEYRHFSDNNIYGLNFNSQLLTFNFPWYNIYCDIETGEDVVAKMKRDKRRQLKQSFEAGVEVVLEPTREQIVEWYVLLKHLYRRIHRPLPSCQLFLRLNKSGVGKLFVVTYQGKVVSGSALLVFKCNSSQHVYEFYRASTPDKLQGIYPSVVATWQELQFASIQGALFDFMGAGPQNKPYGVRDFKLTFGGELIKEYRYRKYLLL